MKFLHKKSFIFLLIVVLAFVLGFYFIESKTDFLANLVEQFDGPATKLSNPPPVIKAVYATGWSAGSKRYLNYLDELFQTTQVNAVVIDIKDVSGFIYYKAKLEEVKKYGSYKLAIPNIDDLIRYLHNKGIYVIARQVVFKDYNLAQKRPDLAVYDKSKTQDGSNSVLWQDKNGMHWVDPASKEVQDYNILIAKDALSHGFDEVNFDYIRFPSDGRLKDIGFPFFDSTKTPRRLVIKDFFQKIRKSLPNDRISIDLFGLTTVDSGDLGVGQVFEDSFDYFDYISPMLYPSHYASGFLGYKNPAEYPYEVVKYSMDKAILRYSSYFQSKEKNPSAPGHSTELSQSPRGKLSQIRPWLQDFDLGTYYNEEMVKQEIKAVESSMGNDFNGFMLWNPLNLYSKEAVLKENIDL